MKTNYQKALFIFFLITSTAFSASAQRTITGRVTDETGEGLIGANVVIVGTNNGTTTDIDGKFLIELDKENKMFFVSYIGFKTQEITTDTRKHYDIIMLEDYQLSDCPPIIIYPEAFNKPKSEELIRDLDVGTKTDIAPILNQATGVFMHAGALNTNRITIRGIGARSLFGTAKIRAYLHNIPLTTGDGGTSIEDINLNQLGSISVIKGPGSSLYGSGLGGTIILNNERFDNNRFTTETSIGSYGLRRFSNQAYFYKEGFSLKLYHNKTHSDGYRANNEYDRQNLTLNSRWEINDKNNISIIANYIDLKAFIPSSLDSANYSDNPEAAAFTWAQAKGFEDYQKGIFGINYGHSFNDYWYTDFSVFTNFKNSHEVRPFNTLDEKSFNQGLRTKTTYQHNEYEFNFGFEGFNENYDWQTYAPNDSTQGALLSDNLETRRYGNLFFDGNYRFKSFIFKAGFNVNKTNYDLIDNYTTDTIDQTGQYGFDYIVSPNFGIVYKLRYNINLYANVGHGFSPPSLSETLTPDGLVNLDIQPEKGWNFELGSKGYLFDTKLYYTAAIYSMRIEDLLVAKRTSNDTYIGINAGKTVHNGLELSLKYTKKYDFGLVQLRSAYTYAAYTFKDFEDDGNDYSGNQLTGIPTHRVNTHLYYKADMGLYANANYQFVDKMPMRDDNSIYSEAYDLINFRIGYEKMFDIFDTQNFKINVHFGINNVLDEKYASMILVNASSFGGRPPRYYYPGLPRNYYGGISLSLFL